MKYPGITERLDVRMALLVVAVVLFALTAGVAQAVVIIVDDGDPGFYASPNWKAGLSSGAYGGDFHWRAAQPVSDPATWSYTAPAAGKYDICAWWVAGTNRSSQVPYTVYHSGGSTTVLVNQQVNGGKWNSLGSFDLGAAAYQVKVSCWTTSGSVVIADAIRVSTAISVD